MSDRITNYKWVNNGINEHRIELSRLEDYLSKNQDYHLGRISKPNANKGKVAINNGKIDKRLDPKDAAQFIKDHPGWVYGRLTGFKFSEGNKFHRLEFSHSESTKKKISNKLLGNKNNLGHKHSKEARRKMSESKKNKPFSLTHRKHLSEAHIEVMKRLDSNRSKNEIRIFNYLSKYFETIPQYVIAEDMFPHPYDMLVVLPNGINLIIEYDGDYWHSSNNPRWDPDMDDFREVYALKNGFSYLIIKESDFKSKGDLKFLKSQVAKYYPEFSNMHLNHGQH